MEVFIYLLVFAVAFLIGAYTRWLDSNMLPFPPTERELYESRIRNLQKQISKHNQKRDSKGRFA